MRPAAPRPHIPLYRRLLGYRILRIPASAAAEALELCRRHALVYHDLIADAEGITLSLSRQTARLLLSLLPPCDPPAECLREGGLPLLLRGLARRPGLICGALLGLLLWLSASGVVWDIRITGNTTVPDRAIEESLASCGLSVGTPLRGFRADVTENRVLLLDDCLAWLSVNRRGTVAYVEVREARPRPEVPAGGPCDIVATDGGIIQRVELVAGNVRVAAGDMVSPGQVLVSGLYDSEQLGIRFTRAEARVYARIVREITVTIPLCYEQTVYEIDPHSTNAGICQEKYLIFFGKRIKFSKKTGNPGALCDTIVRNKDLGLVPGVGFPISILTEWHLPATTQRATRTYAEAEELAYIELARRIHALPGGPELLEKKVTTTRTPDALLLTCTLTCIADIGRVREIEVR